MRPAPDPRPRPAGVVRTARGLLALAMIIGPGVQVAIPLAQPWPLDTNDYVAAISAHTDGYRAVAWLALIGALTMAPAVIGVGLVVWRGAPRFALAGTVLALPGMLNPDGNPGDLVYAAARAGTPVGHTHTMLDHLGSLPAFSSIGFYAFVVAFAVGGLLLGTGLVLGHSAPPWAAAALLLAAATALAGAYLPLPAALSTTAWAVATIGFAGCAISLVRPRPRSVLDPEPDSSSPRRLPAQ